jgi:hypothetical protein
MDSLAGYLNECGVKMSEGDFLALLRETLEGIAGKDLWAEPEQELPPEELAVLRDGGFSTKRETLGSDDPVFRGALDFSALIASALSSKEAARLLGVNPSRIRQRLTQHRPSLYGVKWRSEWLLPRFQFAGKVEVPGLDEVVPRLDANLNPVAVARWFLSPNPDLIVEKKDDGDALSPREWLLAGHSPMEVARLAEDL